MILTNRTVFPMFPRKILLAGLVLLLSCASAVAAQNKTDAVYVDQELGDCINTFTLRMLVAASNAGKAYGDYNGSRFLMTRYVNGDVCQVESLQVSADGQTLEDRNAFQCLFENPMENSKGY